MRLTRLLPWRARLGLAGTLGRAVVARVPRLRARIAANLAHVLPETTPQERAAIARETGDNFARTTLEMVSSRGFAARRPWRQPVGEGVAVIEAAVREGRGVVIVSGHFGQWEAGRAWIKTLGRDCAAAYRPLANPRLEAFYRGEIAFTGAPMFRKGRASVRPMMAHLAKGGILALLVDQHERRAAPLDFLGQPAPTTLIGAELALRFGLPLIPGYGIREPDGEHIALVFEAPVPPSDARTMMQAVNDSLAAQIRARPGQYYWLHRRWAKNLPGFAER